MSILKRFLTNEDGVTSIEYALIASLIAVFIIAAVQLLGTQLSTVFTEVGNSLKRLKRGAVRRASGVSAARGAKFLLRLWLPQSNDKQAAGDRAAERRRYPEGQTSFDGASDVVDKALSGVGVALEMGKGDARLAEYRAVALHHQHDRQPRAGQAERLAVHAGAELALKVHKRVGGRRIWVGAGATAQIDVATNAIIARAPVIEPRSGGAPRRACAPNSRRT